MVLELDTSGQGYKTTFNLHSTNVWNKVWIHCKSWKCRGSSNEWIMWAVNSADFWRGVGNLMLHFLSNFFFNFENLCAHLVANNLNFPIHPPTFAFWMSLRVAMALFPRNDIFFRHPVYNFRNAVPFQDSRWRTEDELRTHSWTRYLLQLLMQNALGINN